MINIEQRLYCVSFLVDHFDFKVEDAVNRELAIFQFSQRNPLKYQQRLVDSMTLLREQTSLASDADIACLDASHLRRGTSIEAFFLARIRDSEAQENLLNESKQVAKQAADAAIAKRSIVIRCRRCGNTDSESIRTDLKQARSLDEGMSAYYQCKKCDHRWSES